MWKRDWEGGIRKDKAKSLGTPLKNAELHYFKHTTTMGPTAPVLTSRNLCHLMSASCFLL